MTLSNDEVKQLARGLKLKKKAIAGKNRGTMINLDLLAGAIAVMVNNNKDGISVSQAHTKTIEIELSKKVGRTVSRNMVGARMNKLWEIGFCQKKQEMIEVEGHDPYPRNIYYLGDPDVTPVQSRLHLEGKFSKRRFDRIFKESHSFVKPENNFEEAIFDLISDTGEATFPTTLSDYREYVVTQFKKELAREHRLIQLHGWIHEAYPTAAAMHETEVKTVLELVVYFAIQYSNNLWAFVQNQLEVLMKLAETREVLPFNEAEYQRLTSLDPDYWTPIHEMKNRKKKDETTEEKKRTRAYNAAQGTFELE